MSRRILSWRGCGIHRLLNEPVENSRFVWVLSESLCKVAVMTDQEIARYLQDEATAAQASREMAIAGTAHNVKARSAAAADKTADQQPGRPSLLAFAFVPFVGEVT
jgi:hypothetical protein